MPEELFFLRQFKLSVPQLFKDEQSYDALIGTAVTLIEKIQGLG